MNLDVKVTILFDSQKLLFEDNTLYSDTTQLIGDITVNYSDGSSDTQSISIFNGVTSHEFDLPLDGTDILEGVFSVEYVVIESLTTLIGTYSLDSSYTNPVLPTLALEFETNCGTGYTKSKDITNYNLDEFIGAKPSVLRTHEFNYPTSLSTTMGFTLNTQDISVPYNVSGEYSSTLKSTVTWEHVDGYYFIAILDQVSLTEDRTCNKAAIKATIDYDTKKIIVEDISTYGSLVGMVGTLTYSLADVAASGMTLIDAESGVKSVEFDMPLEVGGGMIEGEFVLEYDLPLFADFTDHSAELVFDFVNSTAIEAQVEIELGIVDIYVESNDVTDYTVADSILTNLDRSHSLQYPTANGTGITNSEQDTIKIINPLEGTFTSNLHLVAQYLHDNGYYFIFETEAILSDVYTYNPVIYVKANNLYARYKELLGINFVQAERIKAKWFALLSELALYNQAKAEGDVAAVNEHLEVINSILDANYN